MPKTAEAPIRHVGIVGGGTAGYLTAISFLKFKPELKITLIESPRIPVIGVGESSVINLVSFLHKYLDIDVHEFYRAVKPTWKLGIKFDWGDQPEGFNYVFSRSHQLEAIHLGNDSRDNSLLSILMKDNKSHMIDRSGQKADPAFALNKLSHAYHIDNELFIAFLERTAKARGLIHINDTIIEIYTNSESGHISSLRGEKNDKYEFDLYVDCTGFRSQLLEKTLNDPFCSYESSLFTDRALTFNLPNHGDIKPYTGVTTMNNGWLWNIPLRTEDHMGYVYSSTFCDAAEAQHELEDKFGSIDNPKSIRFRSGRHEHSWSGNVFAVGNSFGFVEPLESTGIQMIVATLKTLFKQFPTSLTDENSINHLNQTTNENWDSVRWCLAIHYKYNTRIDSPFWQACQRDTDIGAAAKVVNYYKANGSLVKAHNEQKFDMSTVMSDRIFRCLAYDVVLSGQGILPDIERSKMDAMTEKSQLELLVPLWKAISKNAFPLAEALAIFESQDYEGINIPTR